MKPGYFENRTVLCANGNCPIKDTCERFKATHGVKENNLYPHHSCRNGTCDHFVPKGGAI